jgi:hypothetical protein
MLRPARRRPGDQHKDVIAADAHGTHAYKRRYARSQPAVFSLSLPRPSPSPPTASSAFAPRTLTNRPPRPPWLTAGRTLLRSRFVFAVFVARLSDDG